MTEIYNKKSLETIRKKLRNNMVSTEIILWSRLKNRQLKGLKFRRQYSIGNYIVDFYCPEHRLAIELDGMTHDNTEKFDIIRQKYIGVIWY